MTCSNLEHDVTCHLEQHVTLEVIPGITAVQSGDLDYLACCVYELVWLVEVLAQHNKSKKT